MAQTVTREPMMAGQGWYPADPRRLSETLETYFREVSDVPLAAGRLLGLLAPHAGYVYSGRVAAAAFRQLLGRESDYDLVVLLGTSHHEPSGGMLYRGDYFRTPLGRVPVEKTLVERLCQDHELFVEHERAHRHDHSLEMQLPFLQARLASFSLLPILVGQAEREILLRMGQCLGAVLTGRRALVVISSDLTHYPAQAEARRIDTAALEAIRRMDFDETLDRIQLLEREPVRNLHCVLCGKNALAVGLAALETAGARRAEVLMYRNSGDVSGDLERCVGYGAVGFFADEKPCPRADSESESSRQEAPLGPEERATLLQAAREALAEAVQGCAPDSPASASPRLTRPRGAFVTLWAAGQLRGCIGRFEPEESLLSTVREMARSAALEDHRFPPVVPEELSGLEIEISVLSALRRARPEEVEAGRHGVFIALHGRRGTLLPQVAGERGWDRETLLSQVCLKAGLPPDAWRDPEAALSVYTAEIFRAGYATP